MELPTSLCASVGSCGGLWARERVGWLSELPGTPDESIRTGAREQPLNDGKAAGSPASVLGVLGHIPGLFRKHVSWSPSALRRGLGAVARAQALESASLSLNEASVVCVVSGTV